MTTPLPGTPAPGFTLPCDDGGPFDLTAERGRYVVLFFYPADNTPGCTIENREFSDLDDAFAALGVTLVGISPDPIAKHEKFRAKYGLTSRLAADPEHEAIEPYGVWGDKKNFGKPYKGLIRTTFIIAPDGTIAEVIKVTRVKGHAAAILERIRELTAKT